jgi:hypothetical protein
MRLQIKGKSKKKLTIEEIVWEKEFRVHEIGSEKEGTNDECENQMNLRLK